MTRNSLKAQSSMMEYILMSFFMLMVIIAIIFFLTFFQFSNLDMEQKKLENQRIDMLLSRFTNSYLFVKEDSVFDDSKLVAISSLGPSACDDLSQMFGDEWFVEVEILNSPVVNECSFTNYPNCGSWTICDQSGRMNVSKILPVNVYRKTEDRIYLGLLKVGVYS